MVRKIREKRQEIPDSVAQGQREQTDYEKAVAANKPVEENKPVIDRQQAFEQEKNIFEKTGKAAAAIKDKGGVGGFVGDIVAAPFRGAERLALEFLDIVGVGSDEEIETAREQLNLAKGKIYTDPDVQNLALTVGLAGVGKALGSVRAAKFGRRSAQAVQEATTPNIARITKMASVHKLSARTGKLIPLGTKQTQWMIKNPKTTERMARFLSKMDQPTKMNILKNGLNLIRNNKVKSLIATTLAGANATWYWGASDNISTIASTRVNSAVDTVRFSGLSKSHAITTIEQAKSQVNTALAFQIASQLNPIVSLTGGWVMIGNTLAVKKSIEEQERELELL